MAKKSTNANLTAEAEAQAAAGVQTKADAGATSAIKSSRKTKPKMLVLQDLRAAIEQIEGGNHALGRQALVEQMVAAGAKFDDRDNAIHIDWHGIKMQTTAGLPNALTVWCNKARRAILGGEAA